jgi:PAS domain S-box-containing protein
LMLDRIAFIFETSRGISPWYPPPGLTLALLLTGGLVYAPATFVAVLISGLWVWRLPMPLPSLVMLTLSITIGYSLAALLLRHILRVERHLRSLRSVIKFVAIALLAPGVVAVLSVAVFTAAGVIPRADYVTAVFDFWLGDAIGIVTLTPFLLVYGVPWGRALLRKVTGRIVPVPDECVEAPALERREIPDIAAAVALILMVLWLAFGSPVAEEVNLFYLCFLPILWIALRHGFPGAILGALAISVGVVLSALAFGFQFASLAEEQVLLLFIALVSLFLGVLTTERNQAVRSLRDHEKRFRMTIQRAPIGVGHVDREGNLTGCNAALAEMVGYTCEELLGLNFADFTHPDDLEREWQLIDKLWRDETPEYHIEKRYIHKDGHTVWVDVAGSLFKDATGALAFGFAYVQDITERRRAEEAYHALVAYSLQGLCILQERRVVFANAALADMFGYTVDELLTLSPEETAASFTPEGWVFIRQQRRLRKLGEHGANHYEIQVRTKAGDLRWTEQFVSSITYRGRPALQIAVVDVTERKRAEEALRESEARYRNLTESLEQLIYRADPKTLVPTFVNSAVERIYGYTAEAWLADPTLWKRTLHPDDRERALAALYERIRRPRVVRYRIIRKDKTVRWIEDHVSWERDAQGKVISMNGVAYDITARKQAEETLEMQAHILENLAEGVYMSDENGIIFYANPAFESMFGYAQGALIGEHISILNAGAPAERTRVANEIFQQLTAHGVWSGELANVRKDGIQFPTQAHISLTEIAGTRYFITVQEDITARKRAEEALRQTAARLRIQHEIDAAILAARSTEAIARAALERLHHLVPCSRTSVSEIDPGQQRGRDLVILIEDEVRVEPSDWYALSNVGEQLAVAIRHGQPYVVDDMAALETLAPLERSMAAAGQRAYVSVPLLVQDTPIGALNLASETPNFFQPAQIEMVQEVAVSLAVALQQARLLAQTQQDAETKALLLREVNHRVKNNLNAIIGLLHVERRHASSEALTAFRPIVDDLTQRIMSLAQVHKMLSAAEWQPLSLSELAEQLIYTAMQTFTYDARILVDVSPSPVRVSPAQAHHLALVVSELTTNTLKYAVAGRDAGRIAVRIAEEEGGIRLTYRDNGPGYPDEVLRLERHNAGLEIIQKIVRRNLLGKLALRNDKGAVTEIQFETHDQR